jgi:hypothetical protein
MDTQGIARGLVQLADGQIAGRNSVRGDSFMDDKVLWAIAVLGAIALIGVFLRMNKGFGPSNIRGVTIVLVATFASILALKDTGALTAAMGILGAIAGYVFGVNTRAGEPPSNT